MDNLWPFILSYTSVLQACSPRQTSVWSYDTGSRAPMTLLVMIPIQIQKGNKRNPWSLLRLWVRWPLLVQRVVIACNWPVESSAPLFLKHCHSYCFLKHVVPRALWWKGCGVTVSCPGAPFAEKGEWSKPRVREGSASTCGVEGRAEQRLRIKPLRSAVARTALLFRGIDKCGLGDIFTNQEEGRGWG